MLIGVPKELKAGENRVSLTPSGAKILTDNEYLKSGATILQTLSEVYKATDMILKVKEPQEVEYSLLKKGQLLFTYLHLAAEPKLTKALMKSKIDGVAYETIQTTSGELPLLTSMSEIAGRMSVQIGASLLENEKGGRGVLLGGVPGVLPANVVIL